LCTLLNSNLISTFYKINIHAGNIIFILITSYAVLYYVALTPEGIRRIFVPILDLAEYLKSIHKPEKVNPPVITVSYSKYNAHVLY